MVLIELKIGHFLWNNRVSLACKQLSEQFVTENITSAMERFALHGWPVAFTIIPVEEQVQVPVQFPVHDTWPPGTQWENAAPPTMPSNMKEQRTAKTKIAATAFMISNEKKTSHKWYGFGIERGGIFWWCLEEVVEMQTTSVSEPSGVDNTWQNDWGGSCAGILHSDIGRLSMLCSSCK